MASERPMEGIGVAEGGPSIAERALDMACILLVLPLIAPVAILVGVAVFLDSPGPIFFRARRIGLGGEPFSMLKFRTMRTGAWGAPLTAGGDLRITPVGEFLRRSRLDEIPQLWNVLRGEMRLVGPRPEDEEFVRLYGRDYREILQVLPGITGPSQIEFCAAEAHLLSGHEDPAAYYAEHLLPLKVALDLEYVRGHRPLGDLRLIAITAALPLLAGIRRAGEFIRSHGAAQLLPVAALVLLLITFLVATGSAR